MKIKVSKGKSFRDGSDWYRVEYELDAETDEPNLTYVKDQLEAEIDKWLKRHG